MKNKVPVLLAFRMMQEVYSPILKFHNEMFDKDFSEYYIKARFFCNDAMFACKERNIDYFNDLNITYSINSVGRNIVNLYNKYHSKVGESFFDALHSIFKHLLEDFKK